MADHGDIQKHIRLYFMIGAALLVLTVVTVGVSYIHLPIAGAVVVAMVVALTKGGLVASIFMHLNHEVPVIYRVLALTAAFFFMVMALPVSWNSDEVTVASIWDQEIPETRKGDPYGHHGDDHGDDHGGH